MMGLTLAYCILLGVLLLFLKQNLARSPYLRLGIFSSAIILFSLLGQRTFGILRLLCWGLFFFLPLSCWVLRPSSAPWWRRLAILLSLSSALVAWDAFLREPKNLQVTVTHIFTDKISSPLRIVVIADLQTDGVTSYEIETLERAVSLNADLVILTGDYYQSPTSEEKKNSADRLKPLWRELAQAPLGAYAVQGNVDSRSWPSLFASTGIRALTETTLIQLEDFDLWALDFADSFNPRWREIPSQKKLTLAFGHAPDFALNSSPADLSLAGHTHGGQVRLPWIGPLITFSAVPRDWASGLTTLQPGKWLYVSRGIGMERGAAPRLRFLCRPELAVIDLKAVKPPPAADSDPAERSVELQRKEWSARQ